MADNRVQGIEDAAIERMIAVFSMKYGIFVAVI